MQQDRVLQTDCEEGQTKLTVDVQTDVWIYDASYNITNAEGKVVFQKPRGNFTTSLNSDSYCLDGCEGFKFTMMDSGGNGMMNFVDGFYNLTINDDTENTYKGGDTNFGYEETVGLSMNNDICIVEPRLFHTGDDDLATANDDVYFKAHENDDKYYFYHDDANFHHPERFNFNLESPCVGDSCACEQGQTKLTVKVKTDRWEYETSYEVKNAQGVVVIQNDKFDDSTINTASYCLHGCVGYFFIMKDRAGDGIDNGYYNLTINDDTARTYTGGNNGQFFSEVVDLGTNLLCPSQTQSKAGKPTPKPTTKPTPKPTQSKARKTLKAL